MNTVIVEQDSEVSQMFEDGQPSTADIARLAYHLWEARGGESGSPEEDWYTAERQLKAQPGR
jgi:hypothetical protein